MKTTTEIQSSTSEEIIRIQRKGIHRGLLILAFLVMIIFGSIMILIQHGRYIRNDIESWQFHTSATMVILILGSVIYMIVYSWLYIPNVNLILYPDKLILINNISGKMMKDIDVDEFLHITPFKNPQTGELFGFNITSHGEIIRVYPLYLWNSDDIKRLYNELSKIIGLESVNKTIRGNGDSKP